MSSAIPQLIKINDKNVFLVLSAQTGPDFTFYLRNDEANLVRQILQEESGEAKDGGTKTSPPGAQPPEEEFSYSCQINVLRPRLDEKDLKKEGDQITLLNRLREPEQQQKRPSTYGLLRNCLSERCKEMLTDEREKKLLPILLKEINSKWTSGKMRELLGASSLELSAPESELVARPDLSVNEAFVNYIKFCALFKGEVESLEYRLREGRVLAGLSYKRKVWSLTFREHGNDVGYTPSKSQVGDLSEKGVDGNLISVEALCRMLYEEIFYVVHRSKAARVKSGNNVASVTERKRDEERYGEKIDRHREEVTLPEMSGLVVVAGSTNSAKSLITRGLIHLYLKNVFNDKNLKRRPHLLTFEDPIEKYYSKDIYTPDGSHPQQDVAMEAFGKGIDYTPRQQNQDVGSLRDVLSDALRQTPKVLFVGETRRKKDWLELIDFAGTGHLVITTAHAGSLLDAMHKIFLATEATTPAERSEVASRLLAVVHIKRAEIEGYQFGALVPALWRRVPKGLNALTAEGLASVLPHSYSDGRNPSSCLGRKYFAERLLEFAEGRNPPPALRGRLIAKAIDWDLQGA